MHGTDRQVKATESMVVVVEREEMEAVEACLLLQITITQEGGAEAVPAALTAMEIPESALLLAEAAQVRQNLERQLQHRLVDCLLHHLRLCLSLLPVWNHDGDASGHVVLLVRLSAWAKSPCGAALGIDASCLGIEVWWGIHALVDTTQARNVAVRASWAQERRR